MDGTLLDSAEFHWLSWREVLAGEGREFTHERFLETFGRRNSVTIREIFGDDYPAADVARVAAAKEERFRAIIRERGIEPLPGAREWVDRLANEGWRQAIASSAPHLNIAALLEALEIAMDFEAIVGEEDVRVGKPDPEVFRTAAAKLEVPPARCIVVEDAVAGIEGAIRAGMRTIGVGPRQADLAATGAELTVASLDLLPADAFDRLVAVSRDH